MIRFLDWWFASLASLVPDRWRSGGEIRLPPDWLVLRTLRLPAMVRENLDGAVIAELDRATPFTAPQVYLQYKAGPVGEGEIEIDLAVVPRRLVDPQLKDGVIRAMAAEGAPDWLRGRNFLPRRAQDLRPDLSRPVVLALLLALFLPGAAAYWHDRHLQSRLAEAQHDAADTLRLARDLASRRSGLSPLEIERAARPSASLLLADLTRALPDGAYLDELSIDGQSVILSGYAVSAASLIPALAQGGRFTDAHFTGGVTRETERGLEHFQIAALYAEAP